MAIHKLRKLINFMKTNLRLVETPFNLPTIQIIIINSHKDTRFRKFISFIHLLYEELILKWFKHSSF